MDLLGLVNRFEKEVEKQTEFREDVRDDLSSMRKRLKDVQEKVHESGEHLSSRSSALAGASFMINSMTDGDSAKKSRLGKQPQTVEMVKEFLEQLTQAQNQEESMSAMAKEQRRDMLTSRS